MMKRTGTVINKIIPSVYALAVILSSTVALANEEAHAEEMTFMGDWLPRLVNFAVIAGVVIYFMRKPAQDFFKNRTAEIARAMQESKENRERAVAALAEMERKIRETEAETARMIADAKERGEKDKLALIEEGKKIVQDVQSQVKQGIEIELQKAKTALATEASLLSLELAEGTIKKTIGQADHERIVKEYITKVGGRG